MKVDWGNGSSLTPPSNAFGMTSTAAFSVPNPFVFILVAAIGAFDGEHFPGHPLRTPQGCTLDAADGITRNSAELDRTHPQIRQRFHPSEASGYRRVRWAGNALRRRSGA